MTTLALEYFRSTSRYVGARTIGTKAPGLHRGSPRAAALWSTGRTRSRPERSRRMGARQAHARRGSAGATSRRSPDARPSTSRRWSRCRSCQVTRSSASCWTIATTSGVGHRVVSRQRAGVRGAGEEPPCANCAAGMVNRCDRVTVGHLRPALQTGYSAETCGGWARQMVAHRSQLWAVPDGIDDRTAVLIEPLADAIHAALPGRPAVAERGPGRRSGNGRTPDPPGGQAADARRSRHRGCEARAAAGRRTDGRRGRDRASGARRQVRATARERGEAHARTRAGLPARWCRRRDRMHRVALALWTWRCGPREPVAASS